MLIAVAVVFLVVGAIFGIIGIVDDAADGRRITVGLTSASAGFMLLALKAALWSGGVTSGPY